MSKVFGYAWKTEGASGYEWFKTKEARNADLSYRLTNSPEPKPQVMAYECATLNANDFGEMCLANMGA